jgi:ubiquinone/menaquinone biosynthesis C-methylase UbiE
LETSAGTGRNIGYYSTGVEHVVFSDASHNMLRKAKQKWEGGLDVTSKHGATFVISDVESLTNKVRKQPAEPCAAIVCAATRAA